MNKLSRILTIMLCFAPVAFASAGPVATTAGSNLTAYNPSNANNNQWATMSNGRYDGNNGTAKADFGNCNALILRCAQPKCANGGCTDMAIANAIVAGCVQSNSSCKQYGDDLVSYMSAQLVASSNAKINAQNAAAQQAAAAAAAQQSQQQMQEMQYQMQQMQQQMAQQQAQSQQQLQEALAQQAAQSQAAIENMKSAATTAAMENEAGISAYQQDAINRGISADVLERQKITGQIMTEIENAEVSLKEVKIAMNSAFEYAKCDVRGNNCDGPKRVKKWRELATDFLEPYDRTIDKVYDALELAQIVGVNLSDIYMMLNNSCNRWGQYMCPRMEGGEIDYSDSSNSQKGTPRVCTGGFKIDDSCARDCWANNSCDTEDCSNNPVYKNCLNNRCSYKKVGQNCQPCTLLKVLSNADEVYEGWVNAEYSTNTGNTTVVACASGALDSSALFARRTKNKNGAGLVDIDKLDIWLNQNEPRRVSERSDIKPWDYCDASGYEDVLEKSMLSRVVPEKNVKLCVDITDKKGRDAKNLPEDSDCGFINPIYAICDAHRYNIGNQELGTTFETEDEAKSRCIKECSDENSVVCRNLKDKDDRESAIKKCAETKLKKTDASAMKEMLALKTTVISQQMYKQYEYLNATLRRLKTMLEKATLTANLEAAGAKSDDDSSSSGLLGSSSRSSQYRDCSGKSKQGLLECMRENYSILATQIKTNKKCDRYAKEQLTNAVTKLKSLTKLELVCKTDTVKACGDCLDSYDTGLSELDSIILKEESERRGYGRY